MEQETPFYENSVPNKSSIKEREDYLTRFFLKGSSPYEFFNRGAFL